MIPINEVKLNFSADSLMLLNTCLGFIMYGVALELDISDFKRILKSPKSVLVGFSSQFLLLPALSFLLVILLRPEPGLALGMILVAACPGGNISNFFSLKAGGNAALSVSLTAIATLGALFLTPTNFSFWAGMYAPAADLLMEVEVGFMEMLEKVALLLGLPLVLGMLTARHFPAFTAKVKKPIGILSMLIFTAFVVIAFIKNYDFFIEYIHLIFLLVLIHNALALGMGFGLAKLFRLPQVDCKTISIETGIQNSGLGLVLIFGFFDGLGGMALIAAWWGIWHMISGAILILWWGRGKQLAIGNKQCASR